MLSFPAKPDRLSDAALRQFVSRALEKGWVRQGFHSEVERADRNISDEDIVFGLEQKDWKVTNAEYCPNFKDSSPYKYKILTKDIEGEVLELVIAPNVKTNTLKIVTKY
jgi:hypothetical protein